jgi:hypothetical protein
MQRPNQFLVQIKTYLSCTLCFLSQAVPLKKKWINYFTSQNDFDCLGSVASFLNAYIGDLLPDISKNEQQNT